MPPGVRILQIITARTCNLPKRINPRLRIVRAYGKMIDKANRASPNRPVVDGGTTQPTPLSIRGEYLASEHEVVRYSRIHLFPPSDRHVNLSLING